LPVKKTKAISVKVPEDIYEALLDRAEEEGRKISPMIVRILQKELIKPTVARAK